MSYQIINVATEKDLENAKDIIIPFQKFAKWANEEGFDLEAPKVTADVQSAKLKQLLGQIKSS